MARSLVSCVAMLLLAAGAHGQTNASAAGKYIHFRAVPEYTQVRPGQSFHVALKALLANGWVWYAPVQAEGAPVKPAVLSVEAKGLTIGETLWPRPSVKAEDLGAGPVDIRIYQKRAVVYVPLTVPPNAKPGNEAILLRPDGQVCGDVCIDLIPFAGRSGPTATTKVVVAKTEVTNPAWRNAGLSSSLAKAGTMVQLKAELAESSPTPAGARSNLDFSAAMGVALLAGLLLNLMPCVLPVIPIRILTIVQMAGESRRRFVTMGLTFALGMWLFFAAVAGANVVLKLTVGRAFDLSEAFTNPAAVIVLAMILAALAANLFGLFHVIVPRGIAGLETRVQARSAGWLKSLGMGVMTAVLATPCSFAFLAAALAYAQAASLGAGTAVLLAVGVGMSAPHALLAAFPGLVNRLPRPGRWMEIFKQATGFILLLVAVWLIGSLRGEASSYPFWVIAWGVVLVFCLWMWSSWVRYDAPLIRKFPVRGIALVLAVGSGVTMLTPPAPPLLNPRPFDAAEVLAAQRTGRPVVVKFASNTCIKCLQQEKFVYNTPATAKLFKDYRVAYFKGNISASPAALDWLKANGFGSAVPLTLVYPAGGGAFTSTVDLDRDKLTAMVKQAADRRTK